MFGGEKKETSETSGPIPKETDDGDNSGSEEKKAFGKKEEESEVELIDEFDEENALGFGTAFR